MKIPNPNPPSVPPTGGWRSGQIPTKPQFPKFQTKKSKFFLVSFIVSLPFWCGLNILQGSLEEIFFRQEMSRNPQILAAQINQQFLEAKLTELRLLEKEAAEKLEIKAESVISVRIGDYKERVLFEKDSDKELPIASLTKLMTAYVALENYDPEELVEISKEAVKQEGDFGFLKPGEVLRVKDLLYLSLMESSNDAAYALAEVINQKGNALNSERTEAFVALMNLEAEKIGLKNTKFVNPTGLEPDNPAEIGNYSTCRDLAKLTQHLLKKQFIWEILSLAEFDLYRPDGTFHHRLKNTNQLLALRELLGEENQDGWGSRIVGGKTGWAPEAKGCLVLVLETAKRDGYLINVILGSENRFEEMKKLTDWVYNNYGRSSR